KGVLISRQDNFAWLTAGADNHVVAASDVGVASLLVTRDARFVLTNRIETDRIADEEVGGQGWEPRTFDWYRGGELARAVRDVIGDGPIGADTPFDGARPLDYAFDELRADLLPEELERYREVGRIATGAMIQTCQALHPGQSEHEIAADMARR